MMWKDALLHIHAHLVTISLTSNSLIKPTNN
jgi:hypothetical protein